MRKKQFILIASLIFVIFFSISCQVVSGLPGQMSNTQSQANEPPSTSLPPIPVQPGTENPDEPVFITGEIPYTSPFFLNTISEPFVMLEDQAGFVSRNRDFEFSLQGQAIGPVEVLDDGTIEYSLALPSIPQGTMLDVDNNQNSDAGVQIFAVSYWSNTWGGPFLEERDGGGWSNAYTSILTDPERNDEVVGGKLIVWAPDDQQSFPTNFGSDRLLFTEDDPVGPIPAGYSIVDLDQEPFKVYKEAQPDITLNEGDIAVNDLSELSYQDAFEALFQKVSKEYPFTKEKQINWDDLYKKYSKLIASASNATDFFKAMQDFVFEIPDAHVYISLMPDIFYSERGGGFGLVTKELSDGRVIVTQVISQSPAAEAGIQVGAEIITWDNQPVSEAISSVVSDFGPYSTEHHKRLEQLALLTRVPPGEKVEISFRNPGDDQNTDDILEAVPEYESLFRSLPYFMTDELALPLDGHILSDSGLGYISINTFSEDYSLLASTWEFLIKQLIDNDIPGLIIDLRSNSGGSADLALDFAGYFFTEEIPLYEEYYYNEQTSEFESNGKISRIKPGPLNYEGKIAVLVSPYCVSACEGFAYALTQHGRSTVVGEYPTAGAFGEVGRGQYKLPDDISMQFPTGRPQNQDGEVIIEGKGIVPDIIVPVTEESALGQSDTVLQAAVDALINSPQ